MKNQHLATSFWPLAKKNKLPISRVVILSGVEGGNTQYAIRLMSNSLMNVIANEVWQSQVNQIQSCKK
jgi:hypothetical protein